MLGFICSQIKGDLYPKTTVWPYSQSLNWFLFRSGETARPLSSNCCKSSLRERRKIIKIAHLPYNFLILQAFFFRATIQFPPLYGTLQYGWTCLHESVCSWGHLHYSEPVLLLSSSLGFCISVDKSLDIPADEWFLAARRHVGPHTRCELN